MKSEATVLAATASAPGPMQISVSDVEALYDAVDNPNNAGKTIVLQPKATPYVLTRHKGAQERLHKGRLELQKDMSLIGSGDPAKCVLETLPADLPVFNEITGARSGMIRVGLGEHTIAKLTLNAPAQAGSGISTDLNDSQETTVTIEHVISGDPNNSRQTRGVDIRNTTVVGRRLKAIIKNCEFHGGTQGIRIANFQRAVDCQVSVEMSGNKAHANAVGCLITHHTSRSGVIEVHSHDDSFTDNGVGCAVTGPINREASPLITSSNRTVLVDNKMVCESNGSAVDPMTGYQGGLVIRGADTILANVAFKNQVEVVLKDCTFNSNGPKGDVIAHGAFSTATDVAGTENTVTISLRNQNSFSLVAIPSQPPESGSQTNKVIVTS
jgi:hypothetical protein